MRIQLHRQNTPINSQVNKLAGRLRIERFNKINNLVDMHVHFILTISYMPIYNI